MRKNHVGGNKSHETVILLFLPRKHNISFGCIWYEEMNPKEIQLEIECIAFWAVRVQHVWWLNQCPITYKHIKNSLTFFSAGVFSQKRRKKMKRDWLMCSLGSHHVSSIMGFLSRVSEWKSNQFVVWFHLTWMPNAFPLFAQSTDTETKHTTHAKDISCWFLNTFRFWSITMVGGESAS